MSDFWFVLGALLAIPAVYALAYAASRAYFLAKRQYTKELIGKELDREGSNGKSIG